MLQQMLVGMSRRAKVAVMVAVDALLLLLGLWLALSLRYGVWWWPSTWPEVGSLAVAVAGGVSAFALFGLYRWMIRYVSGQTVAIILKALTLAALLLGTAILLFQASLPRSTPILFVLVSGAFVVGSRFIAQYYLRRSLQHGRVPVVIYGSGATGSQLALSLHQSSEFRPVAFVDDKRGLQGMVVYGLKVYHPDHLPWLVEEYGVQQIMLAMPSLTNSRRREILLSLEPLSLKVRTVPRLKEILEGKARLDEIQDVDVEDLLGRDPVPPHPELLAATITGKRVLVTGAGGSIGSELCRQIMALQPECLCLFEQSEFGLYAIHRELTGVRDAAAGPLPEVVPVIGSVRNRAQMAALFAAQRVDTIFHAAAYKHVPLVEANVVEGVRNNVFGTLAAAEAAREAGVRTFVLISTDKAVRPANVMGASKRLAELVLQAFAGQSRRSGGDATCFCMVRFGNVLGSSGSVVPLFQEQIRRGGPVTVTHPDIIRYFMTIPEAAQLVIQAGAMAGGGDVFLLDMGEPVRIADLARRMVHLMGLQVQGVDGDQGIRIEYTGLRPGEKLFEELLVGEHDEGTRHPRIRRAREECLTWEALQPELARLQEACDRGDTAAVRALLAALPLGYWGKTA